MQDLQNRFSMLWSVRHNVVCFTFLGKIICKSLLLWWFFNIFPKENGRKWGAWVIPCANAHSWACCSGFPWLFQSFFSSCFLALVWHCSLRGRSLLQCRLPAGSQKILKMTEIRKFFWSLSLVKWWQFPFGSIQHLSGEHLYSTLFGRKKIRSH